MGSELFAKIMHPEDLPKVSENLKRFDRALDGDIIDIEYRMQDKIGSWHWMYSREILFARGEDGRPKQVLGTATDITDRKRVEEELHSANEKLTASVEELKQYNREITLLGEIGNFLQSCLTVEEAYKAIATLVRPIFPNSSGAIFLTKDSKNLLEAVSTWGSSSIGSPLFAPNDCWALRRGRVHWADAANPGLHCPHLRQGVGFGVSGVGEDKADLGVPVSLNPNQPPTPDTPNPTPYTLNSTFQESLCVPMMAQGETLGLLYLSSQEVGQLSDSKQRLAVAVAEHIALALANLKLRETLRNQSIRDPLTGLFNRRYLEESLQRELHRAHRNHQSVGIIMIDIDHFKRFNDTFGHKAGDMVLRELGAFLLGNIRTSDIACRYGGEELTLILPESDLMDTEKRASQIRAGVKQLKVEYRGELLGAISISLGVACFPEHGLTGEAVIQAADGALYRAKAEGRDRVATAP